MNVDNMIELRNVCKVFPGVKALDNVSFDVERGAIHALLGENGAGKSTLIKIISGVYSIDSGDILYDGKPLNSDSPSKSIELGISTVHQELKMVDMLSVAENIFMGHPIMKGSALGKLINKKEMCEQAQALIDSMGVSINVNDTLGDLSVAKKQIVEICKALNRNAKLIIMDEPSATLTETEIEIMFKVIRKLKEDKLTVIYISHRLEEIFELADRLTVLRDGKNIITDDVSKFDRDKLISYMVGREITSIYPEKSVAKSELLLQVKGLSTKDVLSDINFSLYRGEILGITGLVGSGRSEVLRSVFGADKFDNGEVIVNGEPIKKHSRHTILDAIKCGIGLVPEERKVEGIVPEFTISQNVTLVGINKIIKQTFLNNKLEAEATDAHIKMLHIATPDRHALIKNLSGGNQQKVVLAKWLFVDSDILVFDEPTRGIDVGAKQEIYKILVDLAHQGKAILIVSSEMPEIMGICNRILVMHDGRITGEFSGDDVTQEEIMYASTL